MVLFWYTQVFLSFFCKKVDILSKLIYYWKLLLPIPPLRTYNSLDFYLNGKLEIAVIHNYLDLAWENL